MDILSLLEEVQSESLILSHPLAEEDVSITFAYAVGVGIIAAAPGTLSASGKAGLEKLAAELNLPKSQIPKILEAVVAPDKTMVKSIVDAVSQPNWQYLFLIDAHKLVMANGDVGEKPWQALEVFMTMFKLSLEQKKLWSDMSGGIFASDFAKSESVLNAIYNDDFSLIYGVLTYYFSEQGKEVLNEMEGKIVQQKKQLEFEKSQLGNRPEPRKYQILSDGSKHYEGEENKMMFFGGYFHSKDNKWYLDEARGIEWDKQQANLHTIELRINQLEHKRKALIAALDSMYLSS